MVKLPENNMQSRITQRFYTITFRHRRQHRDIKITENKNQFHAEIKTMTYGGAFTPLIQTYFQKENRLDKYNQMINSDRFFFT